MSEQPESREALLQHLEKRTGWTFTTRADIEAFAREVAERKASDESLVRRWLSAKRLTLGVLLALCVLQYYMFDVLLDIASMRSPVFFVPASTGVLRSMSPAIVAADGDVRDRRRAGLL
jgi:hypothetical protein